MEINQPGKLPQGVHKGFGPEARADQIAAVRRELLRSERSDLLIVTREDKSFLHLPLLASENQTGLWVPHYDPVTGGVYTTRSEDPQVVDNGQGGHSIRASRKYTLDDFVVLRKPAHVKEVDLSDFPKSWSVGWVIVQEVDEGIVAALRQQDVVSHDSSLGGPDADRLVETIGLIRHMTTVFIKGGINQSTLEDLQLQVSDILEKNGLSNARGPLWKNINFLVQKAARRDRLERINPPASRFVLAAGIIKMAAREVVTSLTREKADRVYKHLSGEYVNEISSLLMAKELIARLGGFGNGDGAQYDGSPLLYDEYYRINRRNIEDKQISDFRDELHPIIDSLRQIRVAPFLLPARIAEAFLGSNIYRSKAERTLLGETLKVGGSEGLMTNSSVEDLIQQRNPEKAAETLSWAYGVLMACLQDKPAIMDIKVFD